MGAGGKKIDACQQGWNLFSSLEEGIYKEARREIKAVNTYLPSSSTGHFLIKKRIFPKVQWRASS